MHDEILKRLEARLDRRSFLRGSSLAAAALVGMAAASPLVVFAQAPQEKPQDNKPKDEPEKKADRKSDDNLEAASEPASTTETKRDADGNEYRECPLLVHRVARPNP
jgi:hypothetical protein